LIASVFGRTKPNFLNFSSDLDFLHWLIEQTRRRAKVVERDQHQPAANSHEVVEAQPDRCSQCCEAHDADLAIGLGRRNRRSRRPSNSPQDRARQWRKKRVTSFRQIEANRRNALRSTGPVTEAGKDRSRRNAVRHGLCAETVVGTLEDIEDYKGFEAAIIANYDAETAVERELVLRLASLFWRIRRATAIETTLLGIQGDIVPSIARPTSGSDVCFWGRRAFDHCNDSDVNGDDEDLSLKTSGPGDPLLDPARVLSLCFQRLVNFDGDVFERLGRYEAALARQIVQVLFLLRSTRRR
jgi:hypothetical protein